MFASRRYANLELQNVPKTIQFAMEKRRGPTLGARFFRTDFGGEPVRDWLKGLPVAERKAVGEAHIPHIGGGIILQFSKLIFRVIGM